MVSFFRSLTLLAALTVASAAVVTLANNDPPFTDWSIFTLDTKGRILNEAAITNNWLGNAVNFFFTVEAEQDLLYILNPNDPVCPSCLYAYSISNGYSVSAEQVILPYDCRQPSAFAHDPKQKRWFFGCDSSFAIYNDITDAVNLIRLPFTPQTATFSPSTDTIYFTGIGYIYQYDLGTNTSITYEKPRTLLGGFSNVVATSGRVYVASRFFNVQFQVYQLKWFYIVPNEKYWLAPIQSTKLDDRNIVGNAAFDADSQSIVWIDDGVMYNFNVGAVTVTSYNMTINPWTWSAGLASLNPM